MFFQNLACGENLKNSLSSPTTRVGVSSDSFSMNLKKFVQAQQRLKQQLDQQEPNVQKLVRHILADIHVATGKLKRKHTTTQENGRFTLYYDEETGKEYIVEEPELTPEQQAQLKHEIAQLLATLDAGPKKK